jgi:hypothetical protein
MSSITSTSEVNELLDGFDAALKDLGTMRKQFAKMLGSKKRRSGPKDPDAEPGESRSAWQEWAKTCAGRFAEDYAAHLEEVGKKADVMTFAAKCRSKTHIEEWTEHEAEWLEAHPKPEAKKAEPKKKAGKGGAKAAIVASEDEAALVASLDEEPAKKPKKASKKVEEASSADEGTSKKSKKATKKAESADEGSTSSKKAKKKAPVADEALPEASPAPEAKKRPTKAEKEAAAAAATAASEAAAKANPPTPFKYRGKDYLKNDANQVWQVGEDGAVGAWHGLLSEDGKKMEKSDGPV